MPECVRDLLVDPSCDGMRLDAFLAAGEGMPSRSACARLIEDGAVTINQTTATSKSERVLLGDRVQVTLPEVDVEPGALRPNPDIPLDIRYAPAKNAQLYFKKYSKSKVALKEKQIRLEETDKDIAYLESVADLAERAQEVSELAALKEELIETGFVRRRKQSKAPGKGKKEKPQPFVYKSSSGLDILAGRNNRENDYLTFRVAGRNDLWFHTKDIPGSHVILFCRNKEPDDRSIYEAAQIAAFHSKGNRSENVPVDYTKVRYVKKPNGAKPGMVIFTDNHTVYVEPKRP